jgi:predicted nucleotidyltransferase
MLRKLLELLSTDVYTIGGVAENRTTIYSDIDILIAIPTKVLDKETKKNFL